MTTAWIVVLGLCLGSFVNALVWRVRQQSKRNFKKMKKADRDNLSILKGRSLCPNCKHELSPLDLVPILSWLFLRGKCRYCHKPINWQYPAVELLTAILFVTSYIFWGNNWSLGNTVLFVLWLIVLTGYITLIVFDLRWIILPNRIVYPLLVVGVLGAIITVWLSDSPLDQLINSGLSVALAGGIFYLIFMISDGRWIGGGDVKLGALIGLTLSSPSEAFLMLLLASLLGTLVVIPGLILKVVTASSKIPFGPFLIISGIIVKLFGAGILNWYQNTLLISGL